MKNIEVIPYCGSKRCCDCGRIGSYTVIKDGYQFTACRDCVDNFFPEEAEES